MQIRRAPRTVMVALVAVVAATLVALGGVTGTAHAAASASQVQAMAPSTYEKKVQYWINQERAERGLRALRLQSCTDYYSERWSQHLADTGEFYHQSLDPFFTQCGARYAGETLARGTATPRSMVNAWMKYDGHRKVMLSKSPRRVGIAAVLDAQCRWVLTANYTRF